MNAPLPPPTVRSSVAIPTQGPPLESRGRPCRAALGYCPEPLEPLEPLDPLDPDPIVEPLDPDPLLPVDPVLPPLDWANAAPAPSIEITAKRFHHVFCMRKRSR